jgi:hypothetical protein
MNKKCLETKTFTKNVKTNNFSTRKTSFFFSTFLRSCSNHKGISLNLRATYALNALQKLMTKDFFLAIDAATQFSNKEANEKRDFFILFQC